MRSVSSVLVLLLCITSVHATIITDNNIEAKCTDSTQKYWVSALDRGEYIISADGLYGLMDSSGTILIHPKFDLILREQGGVRTYYQSMQCGLINAEGQVSTKPFATEIREFRDGIAIYQSVNASKMGLVSVTGKRIKCPEMYHLWRVGQGLYGFVNGQRSGVINRKGKLVFENEAHNTYPWTIIAGSADQYFFIHGACKTPLYQLSDNKMVDAKWVNDSTALFGYRDADGQWVITPQFQFANAFKYGAAVVKKNDKWGLIDHDGAWILPLDDKHLYPVSQDLIICGQTGAYGIINYNGEVKVNMRYDSLIPFGGGLFAYLSHKNIYIGQSLQKQYGVIDAKGNVVIAAVFDHAFSYQGGAYVVRSSKEMHLPTGAIRGYMDLQAIRLDTATLEQQSLSLQHVYFEGFARQQAMEQITQAYTQTKTSDIAVSNNAWIPSVTGSQSVFLRHELRNYKNSTLLLIDSISPELMIVMHNRVYGILDADSNWIYPLEFDHIERINGGIILRRIIDPPPNPTYAYYHESAILDLRGQMLIPFKKEMYYSDWKGQWMLQNRKEDRSYLIDKRGRPLDH